MNKDDPTPPPLQPIRLGALGVELPPEWIEKGLIHQIIPSPLAPSKVYANIVVEESLIQHDPMDFLEEMYADMPEGDARDEFVGDMRRTAGEMLLRPRTAIESMDFEDYAVEEETVVHARREDGLFQVDCVATSGPRDRSPETTWQHKKRLLYGGPLQFCISTVAKQADWEKRYPLFDAIHETFRLMIDGDDASLDYQQPDVPEDEAEPAETSELPGVVD